MKFLGKIWNPFAPKKETEIDSPAAQEPAAQDTAERKPIIRMTASDLAGLAILIVEDNTMICESLAAYLKKYGMSARCADNGQTGLQIYLDAPSSIDVILMDLNMPVMDGFEALREIRASGADNAGSLPVIIMSGNDNFGGWQEDPFLSGLRKPFGMEDMVQAVVSALSLSRLESIRRKSGNEP